MIPASIVEIALQRGQCFGTCPVFRFVATRHNGFRYHGDAHVEPLGERSGGFPGYLFDRLAEVCLDLRVLELDDVYVGDFDDAASTLVTIRHVGGVKGVRDEGGSSAPVRLWAFASLIEVAMREAFAIEDRKRDAAGRRRPPRRGG